MRRVWLGLALALLLTACPKSSTPGFGAQPPPPPGPAVWDDASAKWDDPGTTWGP